MQTYELLGVKIHSAGMAEALQQLEAFLSEDKTHLVVTIGPEMVMRAQENAEFHTLVQGAELVVPDGTGIIWAAKQCGITLPERVAGIDMIVKFAEILSKRGTGLYLLGAAPGVAEKAGEKLRERFPDLRIVGVHDGFFKGKEAEVVANIKQSGAEVLYVAMGSPAQERFVRQYGAEMGIKVGIGVGGSFDVISGLKKRAPQFMIKLHLEWLYRFMCEPSRVGRMLAIPRFMGLVRRAGSQAFKLVEEPQSNA